VASDSGRTVLLVSHNMASIASLAGTCMLLDRGRVLAHGPTAEVIDHYMTMFGKTDAPEPGRFVPKSEPGRGSIVKSLEIVSRGRRTDTMRMGDDLRLVLTLDLEGRSSHPAVTIGFGIETQLGLRVVSASARHQGAEIPTGGGAVVVTCDLGHVPLNQGEYAIRIFLGDRSDSQIEVHENLGALHVLPVDVFGSGVPLTRNHGFFFWKADWTTDPLCDVGLTRHTMADDPALCPVKRGQGEGWVLHTAEAAEVGTPRGPGSCRSPAGAARHPVSG
jgi:hypothetical protein